MEKIRLSKTQVLVLRDTNNYVSRNNFRYPKTGKVVCKDWKCNTSCGNGLHALLWGEGGEYFIANGKPNQVFHVLRVNTNPKNFVHGAGQFKDKCKFREGFVVLSTPDIQEAINFIKKHKPDVAIERSVDNAINAVKGKQRGGDSSIQSVRYTLDGKFSQEAKSYAAQIARCTCVKQKATSYAIQICQEKGEQIANGQSLQVCRDNTVQIAGYGTIQIGIYHDFNGKIKVASRVITMAEAHLKYKFFQGTWTRC